MRIDAFIGATRWYCWLMTNSWISRFTSLYTSYHVPTGILLSIGGQDKLYHPEWKIAWHGADGVNKKEKKSVQQFRGTRNPENWRNAVCASKSFWKYFDLWIFCIWHTLVFCDILRSSRVGKRGPTPIGFSTWEHPREEILFFWESFVKLCQLSLTAEIL